MVQSWNSKSIIACARNNENSPQSKLSNFHNLLPCFATLYLPPTDATMPWSHGISDGTKPYFFCAFIVTLRSLQNCDVSFFHITERAPISISHVSSKLPQSGASIFVRCLIHLSHSLRPTNNCPYHEIPTEPVSSLKTGSTSVKIKKTIKIFTSEIFSLKKFHHARGRCWSHLQSKPHVKIMTKNYLHCVYPDLYQIL